MLQYHITSCMQGCSYKSVCLRYQVGLKLNGTRQLLAYADDVNLLGGNIDNINKNTETYVRFEGFMVVTTKNGVFWDVTPCGSCISLQCASVASYS
jgi:hypothetical protein